MLMVEVMMMMMVMVIVVVVGMLMMSMRDTNYSDVSLALQGTPCHFLIFRAQVFEHPTVTSRCQLP